MAVHSHSVVIVGDSANGQAEFMKVFFEEIAGYSSVRIMDPHAYEQAQLIAARPDLAFFILDDEPFSNSSDGRLSRRKPSDTIAQLWNLIPACPFPVHVGIPECRFITAESRMHVTALDTLSLVLSGIAGVWEISLTLLGADPRFRVGMDVLNSAWQHKSFFLYGQPAHKLFDFQNIITGSEWPSQVSGEDGEHSLAPAFAKYAFEAALSLAGLTVEDMLIDPDRTVSLEDYSKKLLTHADRTGCARSAGTLYTTLRYLDRGWAERIPRYDKRWRPHMPICAQLEGFPANLPLIRGTEPSETCGTLYSHLETLGFNRMKNGEDWEPNNQNTYYTTVRI